LTVDMYGLSFWLSRRRGHSDSKCGQVCNKNRVAM